MPTPADLKRNGGLHRAMSALCRKGVAVAVLKFAVLAVIACTFN